MTLLERLGAGRPSPGASYTPSASSPAAHGPPGTRRPPGRSWTHTCGAGPLPVRDGAGNRMADVPPRRAGPAPPPDPPGPPGHGVRRPAGQRLEPLADPVTVMEEGASSARTAAPLWGRTTTWATRRRCGSCPPGR
ncbi:hypothetical protein M5E87_08020 [Flavonifractor plautii]|nr:hypothetical protein M5E87_08020 [Flavonifractor plautii]